MKRKMYAIAVLAVLLISSVGFLSCTHDRSVTYTCPMHPAYTSDRPGNCPICGMTLVPVKKNSELKTENTNVDARTSVMISGEKQQQIGVKTAIVKKGNAASTIRAVGRIAFDPDLLIAEREFIDAVKIGDGKIVEAAKHRLEILGLGKNQITELARSGKPDENLTLPKSKAWVYATIYEQELPIVKVGGVAAVELPNGTSVGEGIIRAVDAVIDPATRSARARIEVANTDGALRPNMFVNAVIKINIGERLLVPKSAVIDSGKRKLVFVVHGGEHFSPTEIKIGPEAENDYVVEFGLKENDVVATNALFLIDSESQLKATLGGSGGHKHD